MPQKRIQVRSDLYPPLPPLQKGIRVRRDLYPPLQKGIRVRSDLYPPSKKEFESKEIYILNMIKFELEKIYIRK